MELVILHLSDIHIKSDSDHILNRGEMIARSVFPYLPDCEHLVILISGDIAFSGKKAEYDSASRLINKISATISQEKEIPICIVTVPGNHDNNFELDNEARKILIDNIHKQVSKIDTSIINICTNIQSEYFKFRNKIECGDHQDHDNLWRTTKIKINEKIINLEQLNISWVSKIEEEQGNLSFPHERYKTILENKADIRLIIMHHPLNWFNQNSYRQFRHFIKISADLLVTGHEHIGNAGVTSEYEVEQTAFVEGNVLQDERGSSNSRFNIILINTNERTFLFKEYEYHNKLYRELEKKEWGEPKTLPTRERFSFSILPKFREYLDDPGAFLSSPAGGSLKLSDIFEFPDLRSAKIEEGKKYSNTISSEKLLDVDFLNSGILLEGSEKVGSSSLLKQLYLYYYESGIIPILLNGGEVRQGTSQEIDQLIKSNFQKQYQKDSFEIYRQLPKSHKIILIDDFDESPIKTNTLRADVIKKIQDRADYLIITIDDMFEVQEMLECSSFNPSSKLEHYKIIPFGYAKRSNLIAKWVKLEPGCKLDHAKYTARCVSNERLANMILTKNLIPTIPLHLITLLHSTTNGSNGDFQNSGLGHYYHYLLTQALQNANIKAELFDEFFQYCAHLAWALSENGNAPLSILQMREFNAKFSSEYHTVALEARISTLIEAKILQVDTEKFYSFRYPYMYYYLKGLYISQQITEPEIQNYISKCCQHLYVREHANTILFLIHHTSNNFIIDTISTSLHNLFPDRHSIDLLKDTNAIKDIIKDGPDVEYNHESPSVRRKQTNQERDEIEPPGSTTDGLADKEEADSELSLFAKIVMLFKTSEILSQALKNQYSRIKKPKKAELITELFNGPLRALDDFHAWISKNPDKLISAINQNIQKRDRVKNEEEGLLIARKFVANFILLVTSSFLGKTAQEINTEQLLEDIASVVRGSENTSFKLIDLCIKLDSSKPIPRQTLEDILKEIAGDTYITKLINIAIYNRLYMFETNESDRTWLEEKKIISKKEQNTIRYRQNVDDIVKS